MSAHIPQVAEEGVERGFEFRGVGDFPGDEGGLEKLPGLDEALGPLWGEAFEEGNAIREVFDESGVGDGFHFDGDVGVERGIGSVTSTGLSGVDHFDGAEGGFHDGGFRLGEEIDAGGTEFYGGFDDFEGGFKGEVSKRAEGESG